MWPAALSITVTAPTAVVLLLCLLALDGASRTDDHVQAQTAAVVGIDVDPLGNTSNALGAIDECRSVSLGQRFEVDLFVQDVPAIDGLQATLKYDPAVLRPLDQDVNLFLAVAGGSDVVDFSKHAPDMTGEYVIAAFDFGQDAAESGSGAVARVAYEALLAGRSALQISDVRMAGPDGQPVQPSDSAGRYLGQLIGGTVAVDLPCQAASMPTPAPAEEDGTPTATAASEMGSPVAPTPALRPTEGAVRSEPSDGGGFPWLLLVAAGAVAVLAAAGAVALNQRRTARRG